MAAPLELNCADYLIRAASIGHGRAGVMYGCTISPVDDDLLAELREVARSKGILRLNFPQQPLLLECIKISPVEASAVRIDGRVVDPD